MVSDMSLIEGAPVKKLKNITPSKKELSTMTFRVEAAMVNETSLIEGAPDK